MKPMKSMIVLPGQRSLNLGRFELFKQQWRDSEGVRAARIK